MSDETVTVTDDRPAEHPTHPDTIRANEFGSIPPPHFGSDDSPDDGLPPEPVPVVDEDDVRRALAMAGDTLHGWVGHPEVPEHWSFTPGEIDALAPPLTSVINRHAAARRMMQHSPEAAVALTLARFGWRNVRITKALSDAEAEASSAAAEREERTPGPMAGETEGMIG